MNKVTIQAKVTSTPVWVGKSRNVLRFRVTTKEVCVNHNTGEHYDREDHHWVVCWDSMARQCFQKLNFGQEVLVEGSLRSKTLRPGYSRQTGNYYESFRQVVSVEAEAIKTRGYGSKYFRHIDTGRF